MTFQHSLNSTGQMPEVESSIKPIPSTGNFKFMKAKKVSSPPPEKTSNQSKPIENGDSWSTLAPSESKILPKIPLSSAHIEGPDSNSLTPVSHSSPYHKKQGLILVRKNSKTSSISQHSLYYQPVRPCPSPGDVEEPHHSRRLQPEAKKKPSPKGHFSSFISKMGSPGPEAKTSKYGFEDLKGSPFPENSPQAKVSRGRTLKQASLRVLKKANPPDSSTRPELTPKTRKNGNNSQESLEPKELVSCQTQTATNQPLLANLDLEKESIFERKENQGFSCALLYRFPHRIQKAK